jgi:hypothetical protein
MNRNIKYKQVCRIGLYGDDDANTNTSSQYNVFPSSIPSITVNNGGTNYSSLYTQIKIDGGNGFGAIATPTISAGVITAITLTNQGTNYTSQPNIIITSGIVNTSNLVGGTNYAANTTQIIINGGGGSGAIITPVIASGVITSLTITNAGSGYSATPTITILSGIASISGIVAGTGYTNGTFDLIISGGGGSGATGTFTVSGTSVNNVTITNPGTGYTSNPTLSFANSPNGSGASCTAFVGTGASFTVVVGTGASATVGGVFTNSKRMRFTLNNALGDLRLSQNARCVVETCNIPSFQNMAGKYALVRLVVSSQDKTYDTKKNLNGNPILLSMATDSTVGLTNVLYNASEFFYNVNVPPNIFSQGYIDIEIEIPSATANIDFLTNKPLSTFFLNLIIVDEDLQLTQDLTLAPPIDYKTYNVNMPIRPY